MPEPTTTPEPAPVPPPSPSAVPLLSFESLEYVGGFRLPRGSANGGTYAYGGRSIAFRPDTMTMFATSKAGRVAEVTIPQPVDSTDVRNMPFATFLQPFADPTEGRLSQVASSGAELDGLMVMGDRLYGTAYVYYDANNAQTVSHYSRSLQLNQLSFSGWSRVWEAGKTGFVSGLLATVPSEWQERLGGPAVTGQCCIPIVSRTSWGPAAFAFDPAQVGSSAVPATPLLYYDGSHATLGPWGSANPTYGATTQISAMVIIPGTRTALYFGRNGLGPYCYGKGTSDQSLAGTLSTDGAHWCYDPTSIDKGTHAYPYRYQIWAYNLDDFAAVKAGRKQPWEVVPYGVWPLELPTATVSVRLGGATYDAEHQTIYLSQLGADKDGYENRAVIHAFRVNVPPPPAASSTAVATSTGVVASRIFSPNIALTSADALAVSGAAAAVGERVAAITIVADQMAPRSPGDTIMLSASATEMEGPLHYQWWVHDGDAWAAAGDWSVSNAFEWTPAVNANYTIAVRVKSGNSDEDTMKASAAVAFAIK